jgi:uncharacterized membrane protein
MAEGGSSDALREQLAALTRRVYRLETLLAELTGRPLADEASTPPPAAAARPAVIAPPSPAPLVTAVQPPAPPRAPARPRASDSGLESRIGSQWLNRIGIVAVLIGVSYFLKYAFDNDWIGPAGRVAVGLLAGVGVVVWSERFRSRGYTVFSYSLKVVGIGVLYLSLWAAFQVYSLVPASVAFFAMAVVTASAAILALRQDAEVLTAFALLGGFLTPVLVSTGQNREIELFSYVALLDAATLAIVAARLWSRLAYVSFVGTLVLYVAWYARYYSEPQLVRTLVFAVLFFALFAAVTPVALRRSSRPDRFPAIVVLPLVNSVTFFLQLYAMLWANHHGVLPWAAVGLAAICLWLNRVTPGASGMLHLALAIGFLTIAIPLQLEAHWITIGWLVESGVLLWVGRRSGAQLLLGSGIVALVLGVFRLIAIDNFSPDHVLFNARFFSHLVAISVLFGIRHFGGTSPGSRAEPALRLAVVAANGLAILALTHEVHDAFARAVDQRQGSRHDLYLARDFTYSALYMVYGAALMFFGFWRRSAFVRWQALVLVAVTIVKVFVYDVSQLDRVYRILSFIVLGVLLLGISFAYQRDWFRLMRRRDETAAEGPST